MKRLILLIPMILALTFVACVENVDAPEGLSSFRVDVMDGDIGSDNDRVPFPEEPVRYVLQVAALDLEGKVDRSYNGKLALSVEPAGALAEGTPSRFEVRNGLAENLEVYLTRCHGDVAVWVEDAGGVDTAGSYAAGASPILHFSFPTIAQMQKGDDFESSALRGDFVELRVDDREVIVTNIKRDGFYCQDLDEPDGAYAGIYVYTHNRPEGVQLGSRLTALRGQVDEFFGFTELGFPDYAADEHDNEEVEPVLITASLAADNDAMEALESSLVKVEDVTVCPVDDQYTLYDQWRVLLTPGASCDDEYGDGAILIAETGGFDEIDPPSMAGDTLDEVIGTLKYHYLASPSWMIIPRSADDVL